MIPSVEEYMTLPLFEGFGKIPRLNRDVVVTEKIDGTNAGIYLAEDNQVYAASRTRWITPEQDNYGFAKWVKANQDELRDLGYGMHWGEWWGQGIQRKYGLDEKRFSLFNTGRWNSENPQPLCCHVVPILWIGNFKDFDCLRELRNLATRGSEAAPGFMNPEGIMIYHEALRGYLKATIENDEKPKSSKE